jgi:hypothetical protein
VASHFLAAMQMRKDENNVLNIEIVLMLINMFMYVIQLKYLAAKFL